MQPASPPRFGRASTASVLAVLAGLGSTACLDRPTEPQGDNPRPFSLEASSGILHDDFTDVDGTLLQDHIPDGGGDPFRWIPAPLWGSPQAYIEGNAVTSIPFQDWVHLTSVPAGDQAEIQVEVLSVPTPGVIQEIGLWLHTQGADGSHDGAMALWSFLADSSFVEVQGPGDFRGVVIQRTGPVSAGLHTLRVELNGGGFAVRIDGELIGTPAVGSMPTGYAALGTWSNASPVARITSFSTGAAPPPLTCSPSPVERGQELNCSVHLPDSWRVTRWEFRAADQQPPVAARVDGGVALRSTLDAASAATVTFESDSREWVGPVAIGGAVTVYVTDADGAPRDFDTTFVVTEQAPPSWKSTWKYRRGTTPPLKLTVLDHEPVSGRDRYGLNCPEQSCALTKRLQPDPADSTDRAVTPFHHKAGPNRGMWTVGAVHFNMERVANVNPGILPTGTRTHPVPLKHATSACIQGLGAGSKAKTANANWWQFNNYCGGDPSISTGRNMTDFVDGVWAHEEFGRNGGTGHELLARDEAAKPENDPYAAMKGIYALDSLTLMGLVSTKALAISNRISLASSDNSPNGPSGNLPAGYVWVWREDSRGQLVWGPGFMINGL